jgi:hypothetical protein
MECDYGVGAEFIARHTPEHSRAGVGVNVTQGSRQRTALEHALSRMGKQGTWRQEERAKPTPVADNQLYFRMASFIFLSDEWAMSAAKDKF